MRTTNWLMLYREVMALYYKNHAKYEFRQNPEFYNVKEGGTYSYQCYLESQMTYHFFSPLRPDQVLELRFLQRLKLKLFLC
jgi:hypothetical protein